jgi:hypothetical protein
MAQIYELGCDFLVIPFKMRPVWVFVNPGIHEDVAVGVGVGVGVLFGAHFFLYTL